MARKKKIKIKKEKLIQIYYTVVVIFLIIVVGFFVFKNFVKPNNYLFENKYFGFKLQAPKGWIAEESTFYSEDNVVKILEECESDKSDKLTTYQIGAFRVKSQKYHQDLDIVKFLTTGFPSGIILDIKVDCVPDVFKNQVENFSEGIMVGGEEAFQIFFNTVDFGKAKNVSFLHDKLLYKISGLIYVASEDKADEEKVRDDYNKIFDKIISSITFVK